MRSIAIIVVAGVCTLAEPSFAERPINSMMGNQQSIGAPIYFTKNMGQWPDSIRFRASAGGTVMWFVKDGIYYQFTRRVSQPHASASWHPDLDKFSHERDSIETTMIKAQFVGANSQAEVVGLDEHAYKCNYFLGHDPAQWRTAVPNYNAVTFRNMYLGVDATFRGNNGRLSYELTSPDEALTNVRVMVGGVAEETGTTTIIQTSAGEKKFLGPLLLTETSPASVADPSGANTVTVAYSTYLGGNNTDSPTAMVVDDSGNVYLTGDTYSTDFPTQTPFQSDQGSVDVFVTKLNPSGTSLVYSTYIGGTYDDWTEDIALDDEGAIYLTGYSGSANYPTVHAYQPDQAGRDAIVTKVSANGDSLVYSTYLGGGNTDEGWGIAVDGQYNAYITGKTLSSNFPTLTPYQTDRTGEDAFVTKLSATGTSLVYSTYFGGNAVDDGWAITVDTQGCAYVTGQTTSTDFPAVSSYQTYQGAATFSDAFVTKFAASGTSLVYSTYLGGSAHDIGYAIKVDKQGRAYVTGSTRSTNYPLLNAFQSYQGATNYTDAFVTKLSAAGSNLVYSTYIGGTNHDLAYDIDLDTSGNAYISGNTSSTNFPTQNPYQSDQAGQDAFITMLSPSGTSLTYSTYLGGNSTDAGAAVAVDGLGNIYVTGQTASSNFPTFTEFQPDQLGADAFVTKFLVTPSCCTGTTGNVNMTGIVDLSDLSLLVGYLTITPAPTLPCFNEANVNKAGIIDLSDLTLLVSYLTVLPPPALPNCP